MRYRRMTHRYAVLLAGRRPASVSAVWQVGRLGPMVVESRWRPSADVYQTDREVAIMVDLAGVDQDELEVLLYEDAIVIQGERHLLPKDGFGRYHAAEIRQGPFRLEAALPASVDPDKVEAHYDRGVLTISLAIHQATDTRGGER